MAAIAKQLADVVVVTTDNPRDEAPADIASEIVQGLKESDYILELDRQRAIERSIAEAADGDVIVIAGKGHEDYQESRGKRMPFSDVKCARLALIERASS